LILDCGKSKPYGETRISRQDAKPQGPHPVI